VGGVSNNGPIDNANTARSYFFVFDEKMLAHFGVPVDGVWSRSTPHWRDLGADRRNRLLDAAAKFPNSQSWHHECGNKRFGTPTTPR
jgi:hypothetical protein